MVKNDRSVPNLSRICPNSVPILHNASRQIWMQSGINLQEIAMKNVSTDHARSTGHCPDTVQTTQETVTILIRYSRICHDIVTIVIRLDKIGGVSRMLVSASNFREYLADFPDQSRSVGLCYELIRLRSNNDRTFQIIEEINPIFSLFVS